ncbi:MAG: bifunctional phosphopantothenoylcysteine decarboxylase/phosphopantothenate--cysteine ligase CoaBC [Eggerthellales bacterium]|nr:bifunctional phosphopantothenoylcysteine decarboxylase/phosphopantothenate--cysteine ligase CoaBC [Eggerthellales bacterium]
MNATQDLVGKKILVTAGPTQEAIDPVRFISNHSTGKMGYALAEAARDRGANVILISGPVQISAPDGVRTIRVTSAQDMFEAVSAEYADCDAVIKAAAVADYRPTQVATDKVKKSDGSLTIHLERTVDILSWLGAHRVAGQRLCGFSMETRDLIENSSAKLNKKQVDMICANSLKQEGAGFGSNTNVISLITRQGVRQLELMSKHSAAHEILTALFDLSPLDPPGQDG